MDESARLIQSFHNFLSPPSEVHTPELNSLVGQEKTYFINQQLYGKSGFTSTVTFPS